MKRDLVKPPLNWIILPVFNLCLIILLTNLVNSNTLQNTYGLQMSAISDGFGGLNISYYKPYLSQFINSVEYMKKLPESSEPANSASLNTYLARLYLRTNDLTRALDDANAAIVANPAKFEAYHWRSRIWEELGQADKAQTDAAKFLELAPKDQRSIADLRY